VVKELTSFVIILRDVSLATDKLCLQNVGYVVNSQHYTAKCSLCITEHTK